MDQLALVCEQIASHGSKLKKVGLLAAYLRELDDEDFALAVQLLSTGPVAEGAANYYLFTNEEKCRLSVGGSVLRDALQAIVKWDGETLRACYAEVGDTGETASLLLKDRTADEALSLREANGIYQELFRARATARKRDILTAAFRKYQPLTLKYFIKVISRGLRIGLMSRMVEEAVALACEVPNAAVRDANNRLGDLASVALAARHGELAGIAARLFHPMDFMLAKPLERLEDLAQPEDWIIEDKYDGIRSQAHFDSGQARIYSRGMEDITHAFPEIAAALAGLSGNGLIDGEILGWRDGRALNFNLLQQRIARKSVRAALIAEVPTVFMGYDILLRNDELLLHRSFEERRQALENTFRDTRLPLLLSRQHAATSRDDIDKLFAEARARGNEGLLLKHRGSIYEPGKRSGAWQKLKRPYGTLDVVVTAAEQGSGRRAIYLSDYTFAVRSGDSFLNVGKAYFGLTDSEVKELTKVLRGVSTDRFGPTMLVRPAVVLEVAFDGVQKSARHKSGYALRFPRILRWRRDKTPGDCDDLARVEALYQASLQ
ncbi:MAG: ATP-dependent DNA ligase [Acidobacteriota bacterium]|nr:ATP-dependent DNA ligase [Acidobacteriota bacterium]